MGQQFFDCRIMITNCQITCKDLSNWRLYLNMWASFEGQPAAVITHAQVTRIMINSNEREQLVVTGVRNLEAN